MSKVLVVTGSSGGIGRALVRTYLDNGYFVVGLDRDLCENSVEESFVEIKACLLRFSKDVSYRNNILSKIKVHLSSDLTKFVVINNAAEQIVKSVPNLEWQDWESSMAVNAITPFFLVQGLVSELKQSSGHVINISSIHAKLTKPSFTCYAASKSAVEAITRSLALELSPLGISVNAIAPAAIATQMLKDGFKEMSARLRELETFHPSQTIGTPNEIASFIKAITDQDSRFLTGSVLDFNGGIAGKLSDPI